MTPTARQERREPQIDVDFNDVPGHRFALHVRLDRCAQQLEYMSYPTVAMWPATAAFVSTARLEVPIVE